MKSINGFNNSSLQGSSNISPINNIGAGVDIAKTAMSNDVHFQTSTGGTSYSLPQGVYDYGEQFKQFDCIVQRWQDPENPEAAPEYRLRCVVGLTSFENYNVDEQGFIKNDEFIFNHRLSLWNVWPTGTSYIDEDDDSQTFLDNGYILLEKSKNYKVFIYKVNPTVDEWPESLSAQIAVIEEGSPADANVRSKYNGGGSMQAYIIVADGGTVDDVVIAPNNRITFFDPPSLNPYFNINWENVWAKNDPTTVPWLYLSVLTDPDVSWDAGGDPEGIPIEAETVSIQTSIADVPTGKPKGNVGFSEFDCARKEIAYIKWVSDNPENPSGNGRFDVYQINNGPINFNYKPIMNNVKKVATQEEAHWGTTNDYWVSPDIVEFSYWGDVEDALSESKFRENSSDIGGFLPVKPTRTSG